MVLDGDIGEQNGYLGKYRIQNDGTTSFEPVCRSLELVERIKVIETLTYKLCLVASEGFAFTIVPGT